jgi:hypothetical protein
MRPGSPIVHSRARRNRRNRIRFGRTSYGARSRAILLESKVSSHFVVLLAALAAVSISPKLARQFVWGGVVVLLLAVQLPDWVHNVAPLRPARTILKVSGPETATRVCTSVGLSSALPNDTAFDCGWFPVVTRLTRTVPATLQGSVPRPPGATHPPQDLGAGRGARVVVGAAHRAGSGDGLGDVCWVVCVVARSSACACRMSGLGIGCCGRRRTHRVRKSALLLWRAFSSRRVTRSASRQ